MVMRYNRSREFRLWETNGLWYGVETKNISKGYLTIPLKDCFSGNDVDSVINDITIKCRFDELVGNGMAPIRAAQEALFYEAG